MAMRAKGEGTITKRSDGRWCGAIQIDGQRTWVYGRTRADVVEKLRGIQQTAALPTVRMSFADFWSHWLDTIRPHRKPKTIADYQWIGRQYLLPALGSRPLAKLRTDTIQRLINTIEHARTARYVHATLRACLQAAVRWNYLSTNPANAIELPAYQRQPRQPWSLDEARQFLTAIRGHKHELLYRLALALGLRESELLGLLCENIDLERRTITIDGQLAGKERIPTKTGKVRILPLPDFVVSLPRTTGYLFQTRNGTPLSQRNLVREFTRLTQQCGVRQIRFHDLRHTCLSLLVAAGTPLPIVRDIAGHSSPATTFSIYSHTQAGERQAAIDLLSNLLSHET